MESFSLSYAWVWESLGWTISFDLFFFYSEEDLIDSKRCATEQILFCQNNRDKTGGRESIELEVENLVKNCFEFRFENREHLVTKSFECLIVTALNPHCFTVQLKEDAIEFDKFQGELNDFYNKFARNSYRVEEKEIRPNLCVVSLDFDGSTNDRIWNRSQIIDFDGASQSLTLFFVDLGSWKENVPLSSIRYLTKKFVERPVVSLNCRLSNIEPKQSVWSKEKSQIFLSAIDKKFSEIEFLSFDRDRTFQTNLFVFFDEQFICVNDFLIHVQIAEPVVKTRQIAPKYFLHPIVELFHRISTTKIQSREKIFLRSVELGGKRSILFVNLRKSIFFIDFQIVELLNAFDRTIRPEKIDKFVRKSIFSLRSVCSSRLNPTHDPTPNSRPNPQPHPATRDWTHDPLRFGSVVEFRRWELDTFISEQRSVKRVFVVSKRLKVFELHRSQTREEIFENFLRDQLPRRLTLDGFEYRSTLWEIEYLISTLNFNVSHRRDNQISFYKKSFCLSATNRKISVFTLIFSCFRIVTSHPAVQNSTFLSKSWKNRWILVDKSVETIKLDFSFRFRF